MHLKTCGCALAAILVASSCSAPAGAAAEAGGILFYAGFDQTKNADHAAGAAQAVERDGGGSLTAAGLGRRNRALKTGAGEGFLEFAAADNVLPERGSIEFWMMPENWYSGDKKEHILLEVQGAKGSIRFREIGQGVQEYLVRAAAVEPRDYDDMTPTLTSRAYGSQFAPERWAHYVLTWERDGPIGLYIGGFDATQWSQGVKCVFPGALDRILIGERPADGSRTWIDEVYIYDRRLSPEEAVWAAKHWNEREPGTDIPANFMEPRAHVIPEPAQKRLVVEIDTGARIEGFSGTARLEPAGGTEPAPVRAQGLRFGEAVIPFTELAAGKYTVVVALTDADGKTLSEIRAPLEVPPAPLWLGNRLGMPELPPPPFTPITASGREISCWGRSYRLGPLALPEQITVHDRKILAAPVEFRVVTDAGTAYAWTSTGESTTKVSPTVIGRRATATAAACSFTTEVTAEYDGLLRYDLELTAAEAVTVRSMELVVPLHADLAELYALEYHSHGRGAVPAGNGVVKSSSWQYSCWLGNDALGLFVFNETDEAVQHRNSNRPGPIAPYQHGFRLERDGAAVRMIWSFALKPDGRELAPATPWRFTFGLQATPVKDLSDKWRHYRISGPGANIVVPWPNPGRQTIYSPPIPRHPDSFKAYVREEHEHGRLVVPYSCLTWVSRGIPEFQWWQRSWDTGLNSDTSGDVAAFGTSGLSKVRPTPEFADYIVWINEQLNREYDMDGIYIDWSMVTRITAPEFEFGYLRDGRERGSIPFFAVREIYKRVYSMLKAQHPDKIMIGHTSGHLNPSLFAFIDINLPGEGDWQGQLRDNYLDVVPLDTFRVALGHQYGAIPMYLPQWYGADLEPVDVAITQPNGKPSMVSVTRSQHLFGIGLLHDFNFWPICGMNSAAAVQYYGTLDMFGYQDAEFFGYWANADLIGGQSDTLMASVYRKPNGRALVCIYNTTRAMQTATLEIDWERLQQRRPLRVVDAYSCTEIRPDGNRLTLQVPPLNYRLLLVY